MLRTAVGPNLHISVGDWGPVETVVNSGPAPQLVAGSAIQAFEEVCPERIDLIHRNYRKLCSLLVDVEEWGQVVIINMLTRYSRTQFLNPNAGVGLTGLCHNQSVL